MAKWRLQWGRLRPKMAKMRRKRVLELQNTQNIYTFTNLSLPKASRRLEHRRLLPSSASEENVFWSLKSLWFAVFAEIATFEAPWHP